LFRRILFHPWSNQLSGPVLHPKYTYETQTMNACQSMLYNSSTETQITPIVWLFWC
jgi:hypothetical protein